MGIYICTIMRKDINCPEMIYCGLAKNRSSTEPGPASDCRLIDGFDSLLYYLLGESVQVLAIAVLNTRVKPIYVISV